jgi:adenylate cyclase
MCPGKTAGEYEVKNIARPVRVWRWAGAAAVVAGQPAMATDSGGTHSYVMPEKPSIAVLPFDNLSGDPQQDHISDGLTEVIIAELAGLPDLAVIARNPTFTVKNKAVLGQDVA